MIGLAIVALIAIVLVVAITEGLDDRECKRYGAPIYMKVGDIMMPVEQCAEYYEKGEAHK